jgi:gliding-associated putative ABC transporter substrate-binding component GldG
MGERTDIIPVIQPGAAMEYALSSSIKKLAVIDKPVIGFVQGHGEPSLNALSQAMQQLQVLYDIQPVNLNDAADLSKFKTVAIVAPTDSFPTQALGKLDSFLASGGNLYIAFNNFIGDFQAMRGNKTETNLRDWLLSKGLKVENNCVVDATAGTVGVRQQTGFMTFTRQIPFPYWPLIRKFQDDMPITEGLEQVMLQLVSTISYQGDTSLTYKPFLFTSDKSGTLPLPVFFDVQKQWGNNDFPLKELTVGVVLRGHMGGSNPASIVLIGDGDFAVNGEGQEAQQRQPDNVSLMVNSIDYLSDDTGLIELRTKAVTSRPLKEIDEAKRNWIKWINFALPLLLVVIYGIIRMQVRRRKRIKRMEEGYV